jgi:uncharacterized YceG family protein
VRSVLAELDTRGALADRRGVELQLRVRGWPQVKTGRYDIPAGASPAEILRQLAEGRVVLETLTIVEGWTFADMRRVVEAHPQIKVTLRGKEIPELMAAIGHAGEHPEGRFFPDTYRFAAGTSDQDLYALAYRKMAEALDSAWKARAPDLPLTDAYQALTLASIVEKETGLASERPRIAGVFVTRLRRNMRLQTDPTVIYGTASVPRTTATSANAICARIRRTTRIREADCRPRPSRCRRARRSRPSRIRSRPVTSFSWRPEPVTARMCSRPRSKSTMRRSPGISHD